jgi:hypothetical protein
MCKATNKLLNCRKYSHSRNVDSRSANQEIRLSWKPTIHYRVHKSPPLNTILSHTNPIFIITSYLFQIYFNFDHPFMPSSLEF